MHKKITKGDFVHKPSLGFGFWDTVEIMIDIGKPRPLFGTVVSLPDPDFQDNINDIIVIVGSGLYPFSPSDIRVVAKRPVNVISAEIEEDA